ncbi:MAG TPA: hypothetical protein VD997_10475 [Phycisphaerales bacterium]|nr:hypothetical protein [Phycisphaerales bacterium]
MTNRVNLRLPFALSAALLAALAGGCDDRQSAADKAIVVQAREMHALSADSPAPSQAEVEATNLGKVSTALNPYLADGTASEKSAASMMLAQSNLTLAEHAMGEASSKVANLSNLIVEVEGYLSQWRRHQAVKVAAASYDPAPQLQELTKGKADKDAAIAAERQRKQQLEAQLNDLTGKAKQKMDAVAERETKYAQLMEQAGKVSATDGVPLVEQANGIKREADTLRMAGTKLQAQADVIAPQVREAQAIITQLENQKKDMEATEAALAEHLSKSRKEAAEAGAAAEKAGVQLRETMAKVTTARDEAVAAFDKAQSLYTKALQAARESSKDSQGAGKALTGDVQLATAFMHWQNSQTQRVYAALLNSLANVQPALADSSSYAEKATQAEGAAAQARTSAAESLEEATNSYSGTKVQGAAKERIESLTKLLETALTVTKDTSNNSSPEHLALAGRTGEPAMMSGSSSSSNSASGMTGGGSSPKATLEAFLTASKSGNSEAAVGMMHWPDAMKPLIAAGTRLDQAFKAKFGKGMSGAGGGMATALGGGMDPTAMVTQMQSLEASAFTIEETGDTAKAVSGSETIHLKKFNGKWMVYIPELEGPQSAMVAPMLAPVAKVFEDFAAEVEAGKYDSAEAANEAMQQKLRAVMMQLMGNMKPPGGN